MVVDGVTLTIEAGTVIKGAPGTGADASALIIARRWYYCFSYWYRRYESHR